MTTPAWIIDAARERWWIGLRSAEQEQYMAVIMRETGRSHFETLMMEVFPACDSLTWYAKNAERIHAR